MAESIFDTRVLTDRVDKARSGDAAAINDLLTLCSDRLERLARKMLRTFPEVRKHDQTVDVLQGAMIRLIRALREVKPTSTREFFGLAAVQIRRELIDLARRYAARAAMLTPMPDDAEEPTAPELTARELERWQAFHEAVEKLPTEEREVFSLAYYHDWTHEQMAAAFGVTDRTIRRWWKSACDQLTEALGGELPVE